MTQASQSRELAYQCAGAFQLVANDLPPGQQRNLLEALADALTANASDTQPALVLAVEQVGQALHQ
jgi:hypothetical protein